MAGPLRITIEEFESGMIVATSEEGLGIFVAVQTWDQLWSALPIAIESWRRGDPAPEV